MNCLAKYLNSRKPIYTAKEGSVITAGFMSANEPRNEHSGVMNTRMNSLTEIDREWRTKITPIFDAIQRAHSLLKI